VTWAIEKGEVSRGWIKVLLLGMLLWLCLPNIVMPNVNAAHMFTFLYRINTEEGFMSDNHPRTHGVPGPSASIWHKSRLSRCLSYLIQGWGGFPTKFCLFRLHWMTSFWDFLHIFVKVIIRNNHLGKSKKIDSVMHWLWIITGKLCFLKLVKPKILSFTSATKSTYRQYAVVCLKISNLSVSKGKECFQLGWPFLRAILHAATSKNVACNLLSCTVNLKHTTHVRQCACLCAWFTQYNLKVVSRLHATASFRQKWYIV
jgi:hypothetical protein